MKGIVASGHPLTAQAAEKMLSLGGNAFDAAVSAGFASVVAEPALTSLGGGGFLLAHVAGQREDVLFDFFVNTPGLGGDPDAKPVMTPTDINFPGYVQVFHTGFGSVAVPGMLKGLLHVHKKLCTLSLDDILMPALHYLENGVETISPQDIFLGLLEPIFTLSEYGREIFTVKGRYVKRHDRLYNPLLRTFFPGLADNRFDIYSGETARVLVSEIQKHGGILTERDLSSYEVIEREPLRIRYRGREILTNPPPASGGIMLAYGLHLLGHLDISGIPRHSEEHILKLAELIREMNSLKPLKNGSHMTYPFERDDIAHLVGLFLKRVSEQSFISDRGTTHISVVDAEGNAASMTTSNGSGSGCFIPGTGIMLNNMMGEDDLHHDGFFSSPPGRRVSSMMIPSMALYDGKVESVLGSGGSKRIRSAVLQVLINLIDFKCSLEDAVESPRIHFEEGIVHIEPSVPESAVKRLERHFHVHRWNEKNMYFGGVHCVSGDMRGWGDSRRGGYFLVLE